MTYQAKITHIVGQNQPDEYEPSRSIVPADEFVVARAADGKVLSRYGDDEWKFTAYEPSGENADIVFRFWKEGDVTEARRRLMTEMRWLMFMRVYLFQGPPISIGTLHTYISFFRSLARYAEARRTTIKQVITTPELLTDAVSGSFLVLAKKAISDIHLLGPEISGYHLRAGKQLADIRWRIKEYLNRTKQTVPIPTRLYASILSALSAQIEDAKPVIGRLVMLTKRHCSEKSHAATVEQRTAPSPTFAELLAEYQLEEYWRRKGLLKDMRGLFMVLLDIQTFAALQVQAFTGMRGSEVDNLPLYCLEEHQRYGDDRVHYVIFGEVTKNREGVARNCKWITSTSGRDAVLIAQTIAEAVYSIKGAKISKKPADRFKYYLFPKLSSVRNASRVSDPNIRPVEIDLSNEACERVAMVLSPVIHDEDFQELVNIDPQRQWELEDDFQVGQPWRLKRHQLRRSLALYAHASGLVSLPTLKRQLQHITQEMALYYCNGSAFADNFIGEAVAKSEHFAMEYREAKPVAHGLAYIVNVLLRDQSKLFGGHAAFVQMHRRGDDGQILVNRDETMAAVKKGLFSYKPTPLGGCASPVKCDKAGISILHEDCLTDNCKNLVGDVDKTRRFIEIKRAKLDRFRAVNPDSFESRTEAAELAKLENSFEGALRYHEKLRAENDK